MAIDVEKVTAVFTRIRGKVDKLRNINTGLARGEFNNVGDVTVQIGNTIGEIETEMAAAEKDIETD